MRVCIFFKIPNHWQRRNEPGFEAEKLKLAQFEKNLDELRMLGAHVSLRPLIHEKLAIIDNEILWDGTLNILSHYDTKERITRWISEREVKEAIKMHALDTCDECSRHELFSLFSFSKSSQYRRDVIVNQLIMRRKELQLSQGELASRAGLHQTVLSKLELGLRDTKFSRVETVMQEVDLALLPCPRYMLPAMLDFMHKNDVCQ